MWTFSEDLNSSLNSCETDLKLFWHPLVASLQSYLKTPRIMPFSQTFKSAELEILNVNRPSNTKLRRQVRAANKNGRCNGAANLI